MGSAPSKPVDTVSAGYVIVDEKSAKREEIIAERFNKLDGLQFQL